MNGYESDEDKRLQDLVNVIIRLANELREHTGPVLTYEEIKLFQDANLLVERTDLYLSS